MGDFVICRNEVWMKNSSYQHWHSSLHTLSQLYPSSFSLWSHINSISTKVLLHGATKKFPAVSLLSHYIQCRDTDLNFANQFVDFILSYFSWQFFRLTIARYYFLVLLTSVTSQSLFSHSLSLSLSHTHTHGLASFITILLICKFLYI
jgi:hypothetical protein